MTKENKIRSTWDPRILERELVMTYVVDAPKELVFSAWSEPEHLSQWYSPQGFTTETHEIDVRVGGRWRFTYIGPNNVRYENRVTFLRIEKPTLFEFDHGADQDDDPGLFRTLVTFEEQSDGKTVLTMRQLHPTKAQRDATLGFGAVEIGYGTLKNLDNYLTSKITGGKS